MTLETSAREPGLVGQYRLLQRLGEGGMGVVHLGLDPAGRAVAVKVLRPHVASDPDARRRLAREVATLRRVQHPRVAAVIDADVDGEVPFIVTHFVPGKPLDVHVRDHGPLARGHIARFGAVLADALRAIHAAGVVHRDVKPANVMMLDGDPILIDFGIAHVADESRITHTGLVMGTPGYLSPEIIGGEQVTAATDWWGWGATIAYAATGRPPFGTGPIEVVLDRVRRGASDIQGVDAGLRATLTAALSVDPATRPTPDRLVMGLSASAPPRPAASAAPAADPDELTQRTPPPGEGHTTRTPPPVDSRTTRTPPPGQNGLNVPPSAIPGGVAAGAGAAAPAAAAGVAGPVAGVALPPPVWGPAPGASGQGGQGGQVNDPHAATSVVRPPQRAGRDDVTSVVPPPFRDAATSVVPPPGRGDVTSVVPPPGRDAVTSVVPPPIAATSVVQPVPPLGVVPPPPDPVLPGTRRFDPPSRPPGQPANGFSGAAPPYYPPPAPGAYGVGQASPGYANPGYANPGQAYPVPAHPGQGYPGAGQPGQGRPGTGPHQSNPGADGSADPDANTAAPIDPERGVVIGLLAVLAGIAAVAPYGATWLAALGMVAARVVDRTNTALLQRRDHRGGPSGSDHMMTVAALPWRAARAGLATVILLVLPVLVGISVAFIAATAVAGAPGRAIPGDPGPLAVGMVALLLTAWLGPGGGPLRRGTQKVVKAAVPNRRAQIITWSVIGLVLVSVFVVVGNGNGPDWGPLEQTPIVNNLTSQR